LFFAVKLPTVGGFVFVALFLFLFFFSARSVLTKGEVPVVGLADRAISVQMSVDKSKPNQLLTTSTTQPISNRSKAKTKVSA